MLKVGSVLDHKLVKYLKQGKVGILPTDTLYGLVAAANNQQSVKRLYDLKDRHAKPGTIIAANIDQLVKLGINAGSVNLVKHLWPGSISIVLPDGSNLSYLDQDLSCLAVRIPNSPELIKLLQQTGPLLTSSANAPGKEPAKTIQEAINYFGDKVDFYVEGGNFSGHKASTVVKLVGDNLIMLRQGAVRLSSSQLQVSKPALRHQPEQVLPAGHRSY